MEILDVPELHEIPDPALYGFDPVAVADFLMTALLNEAPAMLHVEHEGDGVQWFVRDGEGVDTCIAESKNVGEFRSALARFGSHYMGVQLYGGHARLRAMQNGKAYSCEIFMSNHGRTGFWIRVYATEVAA